MANRTRSTLRSTSSRASQRSHGRTIREQQAKVGRRVVIVWTSLLASMAVVCGGLMLVSKNPVPRVDGLSLSPLAAASIDRRSSGHPGDPVLATRAPLDTQRWQGIVIHHSCSIEGSPVSIEREHQAHNLRGLGHHFIIGNGRGMDDGQLHIGFRWLDQQPGAHAIGNQGAWFNEHSISICLVGDGNRQPFTEAQIDRLNGLIDALCTNFNIPRDHVYLHSQIAPVSDPGKFFPATAMAAVGR